MKKMQSKKIFLLLIVILGINTSFSQVLVSANHAETATNIPNGPLASARIDISYNASQYSSSGSLYLQAAISNNNGGSISASTLWIYDNLNTPVKISFSGLATDVIIGNNPSAITTDYFIGVVYLKYSSGSCSGNDVYLDVYDVSYPGLTSGMNVSSPHTYLISNGHHSSESARIDIIADYFYMSAPGGQPGCTQFVIAYTDNTPTYSSSCGSSSNPNFGINLYWADLGAPGTPLGTYIDNSMTTYGIGSVDVAAVQRYNDLGPSYDVVAYYVYSDNGGGHLYENEYNFTSSTAGTASYLDDTMMENAKIDAIDNWNENAIVSGGNAVYMIAAEKSSSSHHVYGYYNSGGIINTILLSGWLSIGDVDPVITCCGLGSEYMVAYYHQDGNDDFVEREISWGGTPSNNCYKVNYNSGLTCPYSSSICSGDKYDDISSPCNNDGTYSWSINPIPAAVFNNGSSVYYKENWGSSLQWRQTQINNAPQILVGNEWAIYPNPTVNNIFINSNTNNLQGYSFKIMDISGRIMMEFEITENKQEVNISLLASGMYFVNVYSNGAILKEFKLVKE